MNLNLDVYHIAVSCMMYIGRVSSAYVDGVYFMDTGVQIRGKLIGRTLYHSSVMGKLNPFSHVSMILINISQVKLLKDTTVRIQNKTDV